MPSGYDHAVTALYQAAPETFVAERKRWSAELKAAGDKPGAQRLSGLERPSVSVWAVNQLWWHERERFEALLEVAGRLRGGDFGAAAAHREALAELRGLAAARLRDAGHAANDAVLRRVSASLSALAVAGGFAPDPPGALRADRDPPGFGDLDTSGLDKAAKAVERPRPPRKSTKSDKDADAEARRAEAERLRAEAAEKKRREEQRSAAREEQRRLQVELRNAKAELETSSRELERQRRRVVEAEGAVTEAQAALDEAAAKLRELD